MCYLDGELLPEGEEAGEQNSEAAKDIICRVIIVIFKIFLNKRNLSKVAKKFRFWTCRFH